jgi:hypothetical protein
MIFYFVTEAQDIPSNAVTSRELEITWKEAVMAQSGIGTETNYETVWQVLWVSQLEFQPGTCHIQYGTTTV